MDMEHAVQRAKIQSLILMFVTAILSGLVVFYSYRLEKTNIELQEANAELSEITSDYAVTLGGRELRRTELDPADKEFLRLEASRNKDSS